MSANERERGGRREGAQRAPRPEPVTGGGRGRTVEFPCPACGEPVAVPDPEDAATGLFCPACGVHLVRRGRHLHFEWDHRYRPQVAAPGPEEGSRPEPTDGDGDG